MQPTSPDSPSFKYPTIPHLAARLFSDLANPLIIPPIVLVLLGWSGPVSREEFSWMIGLAILFYSIIPLGTALYLLRIGRIQSLDIPDRNSRTRLFVYSALSASAVSLLLIYYFHNVYPFLAVTAFVFLLNPVIGFVLNLKWKISIHTAAIATAGAIFLCLSVFSAELYKSSFLILTLIILLVLLPLMIWARYYLRIHSISELMCGALAGFTCTLMEIFILLRIW